MLKPLKQLPFWFIIYNLSAKINGPEGFEVKEFVKILLLVDTFGLSFERRIL
jgi:hypothetical protein